MTKTQEIGFANKKESCELLIKCVKESEISDAISYSVLGSRIKEIRDLESELAEAQAELKKHPVFVVAQEMRDLAKLMEETRKAAKQKMIAYDEAEEKKRRAEEERLRIEAQKQAEAEALDQAAQFEKEGRKDEAENVLADVPIVPAVVLAKNTPKVDGHKTRTIWTARVDNESLLFQYAIDHAHSRGFFEPDLTALRKWAEATEGSPIPGVVFSSKKV